MLHGCRLVLFVGNVEQGRTWLCKCERVCFAARGEGREFLVVCGKYFACEVIVAA